MRIFLFALFFLPSVLKGQSVSATYGSGEIPTNLGSYSSSCNGPLTTLTITLPAGGPYQVTGFDVSYNMTAQAGGFKSHQRSQLHFQFSGTTESTIFQGTGDTGGIQTYSRTNVDIANGSYPGGTNLIFEMRAWRTSQGSGCNSTYNKVDNFTWMITVHYSPIPAGGSVGIGTLSPNSSAILELNSVQKGFLLPAMTIELRNAISSPAQGLLVYCTNCGPASIYQYKGSGWMRISGLTLEDTDADTKIMVEKNPDEDKIRFDMGGTEYYVMNGPKLQIINSGQSVFIGENAGMSDDLSNNANVFIGYQSGLTNTTGFENVAVGGESFVANTTGFENTTVGSSSLQNNTTGLRNTAMGRKALKSNTTGNDNCAYGYQSLHDNVNGYENTAVGNGSLFDNSNGYRNIAAGNAAMYNNTSGYLNAALGYAALYSNFIGFRNTAVGAGALYNNQLSSENTAIGNESLFNNIDGYQNTSAGRAAMYSNTSGYLNATLGYAALYYNTTGFRNVALGVGALYYNNTGQSNVAIGNDALVYSGAGNYNTGIGRNASPTSGVNPSNFTALGYNAGYIGSTSNTMEIGNTSIGWIGGQVGWSTYASDRRVKDNIQSNVPGLSFINRLNPVTYNLNIHRQNEICGIVDTATWEGKYDIEKIVQSGFIAQEVEQAAIETHYDFNGFTPPRGDAKMYSMQYSAFVVPLVKAVQELSAENNALKEEITRQSKLINDLKDTMEVRFQNLENRLQGQ